MLHVVLHQPEIPQNTGNIGRTCFATGSVLWLVRPLGFQLETRNLKRAGMDYWEQLSPTVVPHWEELTQSVPTERMWYFSAHAEKSLWEADFQDGDALVFGSESAGLPFSICDRAAENALKIPMADAARSLNLSNAVAIALYEALRQIESN